ncbi:dockerin type I domain-containing protein [Acetivibrio straminisolvens]|nr:dockerin type I domain-containing protein [Acetivibrio straminisolvens]
MSDDFGDNTKITAYIKDTLKYGVEPVTVADIILGDLNYDGKVNSTDYSILKRYILGTINKDSDPNFLKAADVNKDGRVNSTDYSLMKRYILGTIPSF